MAVARNCATPSNGVAACAFVGTDRAVAIAVALAAVALRVSGPSTGGLSYFAVAAYALAGSAAAVRALGLSWLLTLMSSGMGPELPSGSIGRYVVIAAAAVSVALRSALPRGPLRLSRTMFATLLLSVFLVAHAIVFSAARDVSLLKSGVWATVVVTLLAAWRGMTPHVRGRVEADVFGGVTVLALVSLPLTGMELGYLRNGTGFQGLLNHPQVFGATLAPVGAWITAKALERSNPSWTFLGLLGVLTVEIVLSESRTAGAALIIGVVAGAVSIGLRAGTSLRVAIPGMFSRRSVVLALFAAGSVAVAWQRAAEHVSAYFAKRSQVASPLEAYDAARGQFVAEMLANIEQYPWSGIGFGVASDPASMQIERDDRWGIPTGASVEKGVMPLAVVEELGVPGAVLVAIWLGVILRRAAQNGFVASAVAWTALTTNMGEATLFSPGGLGMLMLIAITWANSDSRPLVSNASHRMGV